MIPRGGADVAPGVYVLAVPVVRDPSCGDNDCGVASGGARSEFARILWWFAL